MKYKVDFIGSFRTSYETIAEDPEAAAREMERFCRNKLDAVAAANGFYFELEGSEVYEEERDN